MLHLWSGAWGWHRDLDRVFGADALYTVIPLRLTESQSTSGDRISRRSLPALPREGMQCACACGKDATETAAIATAFKRPAANGLWPGAHGDAPTGGVLEGHGNDCRAP